ncbi:MAG: polyprenyl synthetase [Anaerolineales bacterium]|nr:polyprenyl synthetase family protein [Anaerolineae bacterium]PWB50960.1 MAG: polyprenyl synthetase [Anaerolineales bacterium]
MPVNQVENLAQTCLEAIENSLKKAVLRSQEFGDSMLYDMLAYHMGWVDELDQVTTRGKRIRPLLVLLVCSAAGGDWNIALPGATAVELIHNFSLIHDDIEDNSPTRRGRLSVWKKWGIPQAINTGDAMFALAHLEAIRLSQTVDSWVAIKSVDLLQRTCLHLTQGQFLDLSFESRSDLSVDDYWPMVEGKTAALIAASTKLGALAAYCDDAVIEAYHKFGRSLGLAFQVEDDLLGIWGNALLTGKSTQSDLFTGKVTLPVLFGLSRAGKFADLWNSGPITEDKIHFVADLLEAEGAKEFAQSEARRLLQDAFSWLDRARPAGIAGEALRNLALSLVNRQS